MTHLNTTFYIVDWKDLSQGNSIGSPGKAKEYTVNIKQNNSRIKALLARLAQYPKVVSDSKKMIAPLLPALLVFK